MQQPGALRGFYLSADGALAAVSSAADVQRAVADGRAILWLDLFIRDEPDGEVLDRVFHFHPLSIEDCVQARIDPPKIDDYGDYLFVVVLALTAYVPHEELEAIEVDFYLGPNYVISCHQQVVPALDEFAGRVSRGNHVLERGAGWLLHGLLDALVDEYLPIVDAVDETIDALEEMVIRQPDTRHLQQIMMVKRNALRLRRATTPQRDIMNRLSRGEFPKLIHEETSIYFRDIYDHLVRVEYLIEALRDLADGALNTYLSVVSNRLNEVMKILTVAFVPLTIGTLLSGIYGMNLTEGFWPPSDSTWGFGVVVAAIVVIAVLVLAYFRSRRWV